jgi:hypothetical protein
MTEQRFDPKTRPMNSARKEWHPEVPMPNMVGNRIMPISLGDSWKHDYEFASSNRCGSRYSKAPALEGS